MPTYEKSAAQLLMVSIQARNGGFELDKLHIGGYFAE
jgi:hypothetical protein